MPGIEYSDTSNTLHFLVWGNLPFIGSGLAADEILMASAQNSGGVVVFAHPSRREAWKLFNPDWVDKLLGIEVWNRKTDGWAPSRDAWQLIQGTQMLPFVGMDFYSRTSPIISIGNDYGGEIAHHGSLYFNLPCKRPAM